MTRSQAIVVFALPILCLIGPAHALDASDTMAAWRNASAAEKGVIVDKVLNGRGKSSVVRCVDAASDRH